MQLLPSPKIIEAWTKLVPQGGDLVFFESKKTAQKFQILGVPILTAREARAQCDDILGLNERSWYGYPLRHANYCAKLPPGLIESLEENLQRELFLSQRRLQLPMILKTESLRQQSPFLKFDKYLWVTAQSWKKAPSLQRKQILQKFYQQNFLIEKYIVPEVAALPKEARATLEKLHLQKLINTFPNSSGPNCFGGVAYGISPRLEAGVASTWLYWKPLERFLKSRGFRKIRSNYYQAGDVLIFVKGKEKAHGVIYLGNGFIFEKPGQDFYEPYLVRSLAKSKASWHGAKVEVWRKDAI